MPDSSSDNEIAPQETLIQFLSPELSSKNVIKTLTTFDQLYSGERAKAPNPNSVMQTKIVIASSMSDGLVKRTVLTAEISHHEDNLYGHGDLINLGGEITLNEPQFIDKERAAKFKSALENQSPDCKIQLEQTEDGFQRLKLEEKGKSITINLGFPDQQTADTSRSVDKSPQSSLAIWVSTDTSKSTSRRLYRPNDGELKQEVLDQVADSVPPTLDMLSRITNTLNDENNKVLGWSSPNTESIIVNEGILLDADSRSIGHIQGDHFTPQKNLIS